MNRLPPPKCYSRAGVTTNSAYYTLYTLYKRVIWTACYPEHLTMVKHYDVIAFRQVFEKTLRASWRYWVDRKGKVSELDCWYSIRRHRLLLSWRCRSLNTSRWRVLGHRLLVLYCSIIVFNAVSLNSSTVAEVNRDGIRSKRREKYVRKPFFES